MSKKAQSIKLFGLGAGWREMVDDRRSHLLWLPVLLAFGTGIYFLLPREPSLNFIFFLLVIWAVTAFLAWKKRWHILSIPLWVLAGFLLISLRAQEVKTPIWRGSSKPQWVRGVVEKIEPQGKGMRLLLSHVDVWKVPLEQTPERIRIRVHTLPEEITPGQKISVRAGLRPPAPPSYPGGYDFARQAFFQKLGATGFAVNTPRCRDCKTPMAEGWQQKLEHFRNKIHHRIIAVAGGKKYLAAPAAIASALLTGERGDIPKEELNALRLSGLGHLLAISGLHMVMVAMAVFIAMRHTLALFPRIALYHHTKKWAAFVAIIISAGYLLLAGMPVSAQRAFIMLGFFFLALLMDRPGTPLRPLAWAALVVLFLSPEALLTPSFQMSFAAVLALLTSFDGIKNQPLHIPKKTIPAKLLAYLLTLMVSSVIAGCATMPFAVYHFGRPAVYGVLSNLLAIPLATFVIMPAGLFSLMLMPFGLEAWGLKIMFMAIGWMVQIAETIAALPYGNISVPRPSLITLLLLVMGFLWFALWRLPVRWLGLPVMLLAIPVYFLTLQKPDLIVDGGGKLFAIRSSDGEYYFSSRTKARFARQEWSKMLGVDDAKKIFEKKATDNKTPWHCAAQACIRRAENELPVVVKWGVDDGELCVSGAWNILLTKKSSPCAESKGIITEEELREQGTHVVTVKGEELRIKTVAASRGTRLWTGAANLPKNRAAEP